MVRAAIITLSLLGLAACSEVSAGLTPEKVMCADYIIAVDDFQDGLLTEPEFRAELGDVVSEAQNTAAEQLARDAMSAVTSGTTAEAVQALRSFADHCSAVID